MSLLEQRGLSLIEAVVAAALVSVAIGGAASVLVLGLRAADQARRLTTATVLAADKLEELRARGAGAAGGSVEGNEPGFCDFFGPRAEPLGSSVPPPRGAAFARRWSVDAVPALGPAVTALQVSVVPVGPTGNPGAADRRGFVHLIAMAAGSIP